MNMFIQDLYKANKRLLANIFVLQYHLLNVAMLADALIVNELGIIHLSARLLNETTFEKSQCGRKENYVD